MALQNIVQKYHKYLEYALIQKLYECVLQYIKLKTQNLRGSEQLCLLMLTQLYRRMRGLK
jgi:hypothetical protein